MSVKQKPAELKRCTKHRDEKLKYWCSCEILICPDCQLSREHRDHTAVPFDEVVADVIKEVCRQFCR